jgi:hypothetical protein
MLWKTLKGFSNISIFVLAGLVLVSLISALIFLNLDSDNSQTIDLSQIDNALSKPLNKEDEEVFKDLEENKNIQNQNPSPSLITNPENSSLFAGIKNIFSTDNSEDQTVESDSIIFNTQKPTTSPTDIIFDSSTSSLSFNIDLENDEIFSEESSDSNSNTQPFIKILISQVLFENQDNSKFEFIELFNPNNFEVNLSGWSLRKRAGESDSVLVSSKKFIGVIKPNSYFLISNPLISQDINSDLVFSGSSYSIANSNTIYLIDSSKRIVDLIGCEKAPQFESEAVQCPLKGYALSRKTIIDSDNNKNDFIVSLPNPHNSAVSGFIAPLEVQQSPSPIPSSISNPSPTITPSPSPVLTPASTPIPTLTPTPTPISTSTPTPTPSFNHPQIIEVQYGSENSANDDYVKLYNPNDFELNLGDYKLVKKTQDSGKEYELKSWSKNDIISGNSYFYWVNSNYLEKIQEFQSQNIKVFTTTGTIFSTNGIGLKYNDELVDYYNWF